VERPDTRTRIVAAALELFRMKGYGATGIAEILRKAEANSGSLYHFFPAKEDLLEAVLRRYQELMMPVVFEPVYGAIQDPIERVFGVLDGYRRMLIATDFEFGCPIGDLALETGSRFPTARQLAWANFAAWRGEVEKSYRAAAERFALGTDFAGLANFTLIAMEGGVMLARAQQSIEPFDAAVNQLRDYVERLAAPLKKTRKPMRNSKRKESR
jgi:AcrR family transcriptional regulator